MSRLYEPDSWLLRKMQRLGDFFLEIGNPIEQPLRKEMTPLQISKQRLSEMRSRLVNLKTKTEPLVDMLLREQINELKQSIERSYELALKLSPLREEAYELVKKYAVDFARIECKLLVSIDLAKFDGKTPIIEEFETAESIRIAKWGDKNDLIAKKTCDCLVVHHHRALTRLLTSHIVPMLYLYENENNGEFWMLFKRFNKSLDDIHLTVENIVKIISEIGAALVELHEKNIAFQDFKAKNIYFNDKQVCYICNIGTKNVTPDDSTAIVDSINKFSQLGMCLLNKVLESVTGISKNDMEKLTRLKNILEECANRKTTRSKFAALINELKQLK
jgi:serine/threonine protein kinase